jgi:surface polysaccharide O-acyltransferase-like enzyme
MLYSVLYFILKQKLSNPFSNTVNNLFFQSGRFGQFWFLGALIIIYISFPLLDRTFINGKKYFEITAIILIGLQIFVDGINIYYSINYNKVFQELIPQTFRIESHLSYFLIGGIVRKYNNKLRKYASLPLICIVYLISIYYQFYMIKTIYPNLHCEYFYNSIITIILSVSIFVYIINKNIKSDIIVKISKLTMLIYIIHPFIINLYNKYIEININMIKLLSVFLISTIISSVITKIPYTKRLYKI